MNKLTIEQFVEQVNSDNLDYALTSVIITGTGIVEEAAETELCSGQSIYDFMFADDAFSGIFTANSVAKNIQIMNDME